MKNFLTILFFILLWFLINDFYNSHYSSIEKTPVENINKNIGNKEFEKDNYIKESKENNSTKELSNNNNNKFNNYLIYYWYPSLINHSWWDLLLAKNEFKNFKKVVLAWDLVDKNHEDYKNTVNIINDLSWNVDFEWYIALYEDWNITLKDIKDKVDTWNAMWVKWIFYDEAWYDYFEKKYNDYNIYKNMLKETYKYAKSKGLYVVYNSWIAKDIFSNITLDKNDWILIEDFYYFNNKKEQWYIDNVLVYEKYKKLTDAKYYCVATAKSWDNINIITKIYNDWVWTKMKEICDYKTIQDDYWPDSIVVSYD